MPLKQASERVDYQCRHEDTRPFDCAVAVPAFA